MIKLNGQDDAQTSSRLFIENTHIEGQVSDTVDDEIKQGKVTCTSENRRKT